MSAKIFLSTVSDEFRAYRDQLLSDLTRHNVEVKVQEDFKDLGSDTLDKLDVYIAHCDAVVHLAGDMTGSDPGEHALGALRAKYPDLADKLPPLGEALRNGSGVSYTQWEAWLALYHGKLLFIAKVADSAARGPNSTPTAASRAAQATHLARLRAMGRYPGCTFTGPDNLAKHILSSAILDLLVKAYAEELARERDVAQGFIKEMAKRVARDKALDFDGMKQQVQRVIEIYETEIAGRPIETNIDASVDAALAKARAQVDQGQSRLARATLRRAAEEMRHEEKVRREEMRREEEERRERYVVGATALGNRERDIALAAYDGDAAGDAIVALAEAHHGANEALVSGFINYEGATLYEYGRDRGSNVHLVALIGLRRKLLALAASDDERGKARINLGLALWTLGERESGPARLEEAVAAFRAALEENTRERVPRDWATTQTNLGTALERLGERESSTTRLKEAVAAYRAALEERTPERDPLRWARTFSNEVAALMLIADSNKDGAVAETAVQQIEAAYEVLRSAGQEQWLAYFSEQLAKAKAIRDRLKA
jgi:tetratricopeptide (TPR) repeat protein